MSVPKIPDLNPKIDIDCQDAVNLLITSVGMESLSLSHILNAEGEKIQYVLGTLDTNRHTDINICDILEVNRSVESVIKNVTKAEIILQYKLEDALKLCEHESECRMNIKGRKIWVDDNNAYNTRPDTVKINLMRDGELYRSIDLDSEGDGVFTFSCLPKWKKDDQKYIYKVEEAKTPVGYTKSQQGYEITNTLEKVTLNCKKLWDDDGEEKRPETVTFILLQNDVEAQRKTFTCPPVGVYEEDFVFTAPKYDKQGNSYVHTIDEVEVPGYTKAVNGLVIMNSPTAPR